MLKYFFKADMMKILEILENHNNFSYPVLHYDIHRMLARYREMIGIIDEKGLSYLATIRNKANFHEEKVIAAFKLEQYCIDHCAGDYNRSKAIQVAGTMILQLCPMKTSGNDSETFKSINAK